MTKFPEMNKLKPCPFCGGEAEIRMTPHKEII